MLSIECKEYDTLCPSKIPLQVKILFYKWRSFKGLYTVCSAYSTANELQSKRSEVEEVI